MRKIICMLLTLLLSLSLVACSQSKAYPEIDFGDEKCFEIELNLGTDCIGKIVRFTIIDVSPDSAFGYDLWAGEHLNFVSEKDPGYQVGDTITVKITSVKTIVGSWILEYEPVNHAVVGENTLTSEGEAKYQIADLELIDADYYIDRYEDTSYINYVAIVHNPNTHAISKFPTAKLTLKNNIGKIIASDESMDSVLMPGDTTTIVGFKSIETAQLTSQLEFSMRLDCMEFVYDVNQRDKVYSTELELSNIYVTDGYISGEITNHSNVDPLNATIVLTLMKEGHVVFVDCAYIDCLGKEEPEAFELSSFQSWPEYDAYTLFAKAE